MQKDNLRTAAFCLVVALVSAAGVDGAWNTFPYIEANQFLITAGGMIYAIFGGKKGGKGE